MGYESPINIIQNQMQLQLEDAVCRAVVKAEINVDKEELLRALRYDRGQYQLGFEEGHIDGYNQAMSEMPDIVRCKDCKHWNAELDTCDIKIGRFYCDADWFCADGIRKG